MCKLRVLCSLNFNISIKIYLYVKWGSRQNEIEVYIELVKKILWSSFLIMISNNVNYN